MTLPQLMGSIQSGFLNLSRLDTVRPTENPRLHSLGQTFYEGYSLQWPSIVSTNFQKLIHRAHLSLNGKICSVNHGGGNRLMISTGKHNLSPPFFSSQTRLPAQRFGFYIEPSLLPVNFIVREPKPQ